MAGAGALWVLKATAILTTGIQPPVIYELAQGLLALGCLGLLGALPSPRSTVARLGVALAALAAAGGVGVGIGAWGGWSNPSAASFELPWSVFHLALALGGFLALASFALAILRRGRSDVPTPHVPLLLALAPAPLLITGLVHVELPVLLTGTSWLALAGWMWTAAADLQTHGTAQPG